MELNFATLYRQLNQKVFVQVGFFVLFCILYCVNILDHIDLLFSIVLPYAFASFTRDILLLSAIYASSSLIFFIILIVKFYLDNFALSTDYESKYFTDITIT